MMTLVHAAEEFTRRSNTPQPIPGQRNFPVASANIIFPVEWHFPVEWRFPGRILRQPPSCNNFTDRPHAPDCMQQTPFKLSPRSPRLHGECDIQPTLVDLCLMRALSTPVGNPPYPSASRPSAVIQHIPASPLGFPPPSNFVSQRSRTGCSVEKGCRPVVGPSKPFEKHW